MDPIDWELTRDAWKDILTPNGQERYRETKEEEEDLQDQWEAAVDHPVLGVGLVVGQLDDDDLRAIDDEEKFHDTSYFDRMKKDFFLAYH